MAVARCVIGLINLLLKRRMTANPTTTKKNVRNMIFRTVSVISYSMFFKDMPNFRVPHLFLLMVSGTPKSSALWPLFEKFWINVLPALRAFTVIGSE